MIQSFKEYKESQLGEEDINELSKTTLANYVKKATIGDGGIAQKATEAESLSWQGKPGMAYKAFKKVQKRADGIERAVNKLSEEDDFEPETPTKEPVVDKETENWVRKVGKSNRERIAKVSDAFGKLKESEDTLYSRRAEHAYHMASAEQGSYNRHMAAHHNLLAMHHEKLGDDYGIQGNHLNSATNYREAANHRRMAAVYVDKHHLETKNVSISPNPSIEYDK